MIVDDHAIVREGIAEVLSRSGEFEVVGEAANGEEAVAQGPGTWPRRGDHGHPDAGEERH